MHQSLLKNTNMSHPNPSQENSYPEDGVSHYPKAKKKLKKMATKVGKAINKPKTPHDARLAKTIVKEQIRKMRGK